MSLVSPLSDSAGISSSLLGALKPDKYAPQPLQHQMAPAAVTNQTLKIIIKHEYRNVNLIHDELLAITTICTYLWTSIKMQSKVYYSVIHTATMSSSFFSNFMFESSNMKSKGLVLFHKHKLFTTTIVIITTTAIGPSVLWHCRMDIRKSIQPVKNWVMRCWLSVCSKVQMICIWSSWCHCHPHHLLLH